MDNIKELTKNLNKCKITETQLKGRCKPTNKMLGKGMCVIKHPDGCIEWYNNGVFVPDGHKKYNC